MTKPVSHEEAREAPAKLTDHPGDAELNEGPRGATRVGQGGPLSPETPPAPRCGTCGDRHAVPIHCPDFRRDCEVLHLKPCPDCKPAPRCGTLEARAERDRLELAKENWRNAYDKEAATAGRLREELAEVREMLEYDARRIVAERDALARREHRECVTERRLKVAWLLLLEARDKINASRSRPGSPELSSECSNLSERISVFLAAPLVEPGGGE